MNEGAFWAVGSVSATAFENLLQEKWTKGCLKRPSINIRDDQFALQQKPNH
jgi:hypothetical protein